MNKIIVAINMLILSVGVINSQEKYDVKGVLPILRDYRAPYNITQYKNVGYTNMDLRITPDFTQRFEIFPSNSSKVDETATDFNLNSSGSYNAISRILEIRNYADFYLSYGSDKSTKNDYSPYDYYYASKSSALIANTSLSNSSYYYFTEKSKFFVNGTGALDLGMESYNQEYYSENGDVIDSLATPEESALKAIQLKVALHIGYGRVENLTFPTLALIILNEISSTNGYSADDVKKFAEFLEKENYQSFFDAYERRCDEVTAISNYLVDNNLVSNLSYRDVTRINYIKEFNGKGQNRLHGERASVGIGYTIFATNRDSATTTYQSEENGSMTKNSYSNFPSFGVKMYNDYHYTHFPSFDTRMNNVMDDSTYKTIFFKLSSYKTPFMWLNLNSNTLFTIAEERDFLDNVLFADLFINFYPNLRSTLTLGLEYASELNFDNIHNKYSISGNYYIAPNVVANGFINYFKDYEETHLFSYGCSMSYQFF